MNRKFLVSCLIAMLPVPAAADSWQPVTITSFLKQAPTWAQNCAVKDGGHILVGPNEIGDIFDAALNEDLSCVKFTFRNQTFYVRETVVEQTGAKHSSVGPCQYANLGSSTSSHEGSTMGASEAVKCPGQH